MELCSNPCPLTASISPQRQSPRQPHDPAPWPTDARTAPRSTPKPSYVPQTSEVTPEVTLGARLRGGEIASMAFLLVGYAHSPAHQGSTSVSPARAVAMAPRHLWAAFRATRFPARFSYFPERFPPPPPLALWSRAHGGQCTACVVVKFMQALNWRRRGWLLFSFSLNYNLGSTATG